MQDSHNMPVWDFERWNSKSKSFLMKMYFNNCHPTSLFVAFSPCCGTSKHQWRWRKSVWTRHYVGGNFLSNWVILKKRDVAGQEEYWKTKRFIWSLLRAYKNIWYKNTSFWWWLFRGGIRNFSHCETLWRAQHNFPPNTCKTTSISIEHGSVAFSLSLDKLGIVWFITCGTVLLWISWAQ